MSKTVIISGGTIDEGFVEKVLAENPEAYIIGVDKGLEYLYNHQIEPQYIVGDFDSIDSKVIDYYRSRKRTEELGEKIVLALQERQDVCSVQDIVIERMIAMELVEGLTEEERRVLAIEYFSDTTGEVSNAFKCRRSRLRRKIEESLGIFRKKRR